MPPRIAVNFGKVLRGRGIAGVLIGPGIASVLTSLLTFTLTARLVARLHKAPV